MNDTILYANKQHRWLLLDILRGLAVIAMVVYHAIWNLGYFSVVQPDFLYSPLWKLSGGIIAAAFLSIAGVSMALAHRQIFYWKKFLSRLGKIVGAAFLVTITTWYIMPESFIFFGILHCLAASSVLAIPFLRWPRVISYLAIVLSLIAPLLFNQTLWDTPWLDWLGFGKSLPVTNDYVPLFPWFAFFLIGVLIGNSSLANKIEAPKNFSSLCLAFIGRWSLAIYLLHQPLLFGATLFAVRQGIIGHQMSFADVVFQQCESGCANSSSSLSVCRAMCECTVTQLTENPKFSVLWQQLQNKDTSDEVQQQVIGIARSCNKLDITEP